MWIFILLYGLKFITIINCFVSQSVPYLVTGTPSSCLLYFSYVAIQFLEWYLTFWHHKMLQTHLLLPLSQSWISHFSMEFLFFALIMVFRNQNLGMRWTHCYPSYLTVFSAERAKNIYIQIHKNIQISLFSYYLSGCVCIHTHMCTHTLSIIYLSTYNFKLIYEFKLIPWFQSNTTGFILASLTLSLFVTLFFNN